MNEEKPKRATLTTVKDMIKHSVPNIISVENVYEDEITHPFDLEVSDLPYENGPVTNFIKNVMIACNLGLTRVNGLLRIVPYKQPGRPPSKKEVRNAVADALAIAVMENETREQWSNRVMKKYSEKEVLETIKILPKGIKERARDFFEAHIVMNMSGIKETENKIIARHGENSNIAVCPACESSFLSQEKLCPNCGIEV
jgi:hypothetical protein